jgi:hypothetical protein
MGIAAMLLLALSSCSGGEEEKRPASENDLDAARNFIDAALKGQWKEARGFVYMDSTNQELMDLLERNYADHLSREVKSGQREASITIYGSKPMDDSSTVVEYANSFEKKRNSLKVIQANGQWLIDIKYSLLRSDSTANVQ